MPSEVVMHHTEAFRDQPYERISDRTEENQELFFLPFYIQCIFWQRKMSFEKLLCE